MKAVVYHNVKCSKSNAALNLLLEHGIQTEVVDYIETPLSVAQLKILSNQLGIEAKSLIRFDEPIAKELGLSSADTRDENEWLSFMANHSLLMQRPIVVIENKAVIGRPPEVVLALIQGG